MANGSAAALHLVEPALAVAPSNGTPTAALGLNEIELGEAVASATGALCFMLGEYQNGGVTDKTRVANGERIARIVMMQLSCEFGDDDFAQHARDAAKPILHRALDADYFQRYNQQQADQALDFFLDEVLGLVNRIVASERKIMATRTN